MEAAKGVGIGFLALGSYIVIAGVVGSRIGKMFKAMWQEPVVDIHDVEDLTGRALTMDFMIADLNHDARASNPQEGDALIVLDICGMGVVINRDRRGRFLPGVKHQEPVAGEAHRPEFDSFSATVEGCGVETFKRYEIKPCGLRKRTWVVAR